MNGFEWIHVSKFRYLDLHITRIGPAAIDPSMKEEATLQLLNNEENEEDPMDVLTDEKMKAEYKVKLDEEDNEI